MRLGVCYYPEQWSSERWEKDAQMMVNLGLRVVRFSENYWGKIQPNEDEFDFTWLDGVIEKFSKKGLQVILKIPVNMPPRWFLKQKREILSGDEHNSTPLRYCFNNPVLQQAVISITKALVSHYQANETVIGWEISDGYISGSNKLCFCENCEKTFQNWLKEHYKNIEKLNEIWGKHQLGQPFMGWGDIALARQQINCKNPSRSLDFKRFVSDSILYFMDRQIETIRSFGTSKFVLYSLDFEKTEIDFYQAGQHVDFLGLKSHPTKDAEILSESLYPKWESKPELAYDVGDPYVTGFFHTYARSLSEQPYWVIDQQVGKLTTGKVNPGIRPGAIRLWSWHAVADGANAVLFHRWRMSRFGAEQFQSGVLQHDGVRDLGFTEINSMNPEAPVMNELKEAPISAQVAIISGFEDFCAFNAQTMNSEINYQQTIFNFYRALTRLGVSVDIVPSEGDFSEYRLVIAPLLYLTDQAMVQKLKSFTAQGGAILFGPHSGIKNKANIIVEDSFPGPLRSLVGGTISDWHSLPDDVEFPFRAEIHGLKGCAGHWIESIKPDEDEGVRILARYLGGPLSGKAAITEHMYGAGIVYYLGFAADNEQLKQLLGYLVTEICNEKVLDLPDGVLLNQRDNHRIAFNFTRNEKTIVLDDKMITIPPRDFRYFLRDWS